MADNPTFLTSLQNSRIKELVALRERRVRDRLGVFLIEGYRELSRAFAGHVAVESIYFCPELFLGSNERSLIEQFKTSGCKFYQCTPEVFAKVSYRDRPDGLLGVAKQEPKGLDALTRRQTIPLYLVAEAIEKPGNLGTILRSADAVGIDGVIICDRCTDPYNPNVVRASVGTLFTVPVVEASSQETLAWFKKNGVTVMAATPHAKTLYTEADMRCPLAIAVGTEQLGLSAQWMEAADLQVRIPMCGMADSLNVATATTLLLYEALRQRGM